MKRVYDMSFAEFQIRLFAWRRTEERAWEKVRLLSWYALTGSHMNPKRLPKSITQLMSLDLDKKPKNIISEEQKQAFMNAMNDYLKQKK